MREMPFLQGVRMTDTTKPSDSPTPSTQAVGEPVAWRARGYAQFKTGNPGGWCYYDGAGKPNLNNPECCDIEPLGVLSGAPTTGSAPHRTHTTQPGESVLGIAHRECGNEKEWRHILACNPKFAALLPSDYFPVGTVLTLPAAPASPSASALTDEQLSEIDTAACEWTDDWSERQETTPTKQACNAMFIRRVIALLAASMGGGTRPVVLNEEQRFALKFLLDAVGEDYPNCEMALRPLCDS
jgi:hypothetical protein